MPEEKPATVWLEYTGRKLGRDATTQITASRHVTWSRGVPRQLPADVGRWLMADQPGQFIEVPAPAKPGESALAAEPAPAKKATKKTAVKGEG